MIELGQVVVEERGEAEEDRGGMGRKQEVMGEGGKGEDPEWQKHKGLVSFVLTG